MHPDTFNQVNGKTTTLWSEYQLGPIKIAWSHTEGYTESSLRADQTASSNSESTWVGPALKASAHNYEGKIGIVSDDISLSLKGVGDVLTAEGRAGLNKSVQTGLAIGRAASAASGRATIELRIGDLEIEAGKSGYLGGYGGTFGYGYSGESGEMQWGGSIVNAVGFGEHVRIKFPKLN